MMLAPAASTSTTLLLLLALVLLCPVRSDVQLTAHTQEELAALLKGAAGSGQPVYLAGAGPFRLPPLVQTSCEEQGTSTAISGVIDGDAPVPVLEVPADGAACNLRMEGLHVVLLAGAALPGAGSCSPCPAAGPSVCDARALTDAQHGGLGHMPLMLCGSAA